MALARSSVLPGALGTRIGSLRLWRLASSHQDQQHRIRFPALKIVECDGLFHQRRHSLARATSSYAPEKVLKINVPVLIKQSGSNNSQLESVVKQLEEDARRAVQLAVRGHKAAEMAEVTELSLTICDDEYIRRLNKEWLGKDSPTDVLSFPQDQPPGEAPLLLLGDVVISFETAAQQAEERDHSLLDEMRILLVHGLLHLLGFDHERGVEAKKKMEEREQALLKGLGWKGKGLISYTGSDEHLLSKSGNALPKTKPPFKYLFCDMDGTLLNSQSRTTKKTADALKAAVQAGVQVILATGKTRHAAMAAIKDVGLVGEHGVVSTTSPGVFIQGLLVYGPGGSVVQRALLPDEYCLQAFRYALEHKIPTVGFCLDATVAPFDDPFLHYLHEKYFEPEAEILKSLDDVPKYKIQKLLFYADQDKIDTVLKPQLADLIQGPFTFTQAQRDMLEILPEGCTKGSGVKRLLDHLQVDPDEVMAVGDGENDIEMLEMVGWGVAMGNGAARTLQVADVTVSSNDQDGVAEAVERFILS